MTREDRPDNIWFLVIFGIGLLFVAVYGWRTATSFANGDARVFVDLSLNLAEGADYTATMTGDRDPPVRYIPLVIIYVLINPSAQLASYLGTVYAAVWTFILTPTALYWYFKVEQSPKAGLITAITYFALHVIGVSHSSYYTGAWQYAVALPYAYLGLGCLTLALRSSRPFYYGLTILLLLITTGTQIVIGGLTGVVMIWLSFTRGEYRFAIGLIFAGLISFLVLSMLPQFTDQLRSWLGLHIFQAETSRAIYTRQPGFIIAASFFDIEHATRRLMSVSFIVLAAAGGFSIWFGKQYISENLWNVGLVLSILYISWSLLNFGYMPDKIYQFSVPIIMGSFAIIIQDNIRNLKNRTTQ